MYIFTNNTPPTHTNVMLNTFSMYSSLIIVFKSHINLSSHPLGDLSPGCHIWLPQRLEVEFLAGQHVPGYKTFTVEGWKNRTWSGAGQVNYYLNIII